MQKTTLTLLLSFLFLISHAQDSTNWFAKHLDFNLGLSWYKQGSSDMQGNPLHVVVPGLLPRRIHDLSTRNRWQLAGDEATDNPLWHGAMYLEFATRVRITDSITIRAALVGENRTFSNGLYTPPTNHVYPKFLLLGYKTVNVLGQSFLFGAEGGYRDSFRMFEGLTIYNIDVDNFVGFVQWKKLRYSFCHIGDMIFDAGFSIDDSYTHMLSLERLKISSKWNADIRAGVTNNSLYSFFPHNTFQNDISAGVYNNNGTRLYAQYSYRNDDIKLNNPHAFVAGIKHISDKKRFFIKAYAEARYYGEGYNKGLIYEGIYFRPSSGLNVVGPNYYPMMQYNRPYSKWAVYTEYQGFNVLAGSLYADLRYMLIGNIWLKGEIDLNAIKPGSHSWVQLAFYQLGLSYQPIKNTYIFAGISNKGMNLDKHYSDFYAYTHPTSHIQVIRTFGW